MVCLTLDALDLDRIADSGQCFRWIHLSDGHYAIPLHGTVFTVRQTAPNAMAVECDWDEARALEAMRAYFDAECDYASIYAGIDLADRFLIDAAAYGRGIRILRQPLWEATASMIISQNNNIPRIKGIIERICGGESAPFPQPRAFVAMGENALRAAGAGYRAGYLFAAAQRFTDQEERELQALDYPQARERLMTYTGIGGKVADCICLFGLGHKRAFPRDVWVKRVLSQRYPQGFALEDSPHAGVYQQVLFAHERALSERERQAPCG